MELLERIEIERECGRLPLLFARYADNGDHASLAQLFTEDCEFARPFQPDHPFLRPRPCPAISATARRYWCATSSPTCGRGDQRDRGAGTNYLAMLVEPRLDRAAAGSRRAYVGGFEDHYLRRREAAVQEPLWPRGGTRRRRCPNSRAQRRSERPKMRPFNEATAANANEQLVLDFFEVLSSGDLEALRAFYHEKSVWEPKVQGHRRRRQAVGMDSSTSSSPRYAGCSSPRSRYMSDPILGRAVVCVGVLLDRQDARRPRLRERLLLGVRGLERQGDARREYMDSHYTAKLFGMD